VLNTPAWRQIRGRAFGEFDQVAWVTMTDQDRDRQPALDIWDENI
jgi:hypothetical protein